MNKKGILAGKKGSEKYYILISMILGLLVVAIVLFFLFREYFTTDEMDWAACRQSVILRNSAPSFHNIVDAKELFPLKCKTAVVEVDTEDEKEANRIIAETLAQCWYLWGEGSYSLFPQKLLSGAGDCAICARIHFSEKTKKAFENQNLLIPFYLYGTNLEGQEIPEDEWRVRIPATETESAKSVLTGVEGSYAKYLFSPKGVDFDSTYQDALKLPKSGDNLKNADWGMRTLIIPSNGDLLLGVYFSKDSSILAFQLNLIEKLGRIGIGSGGEGAKFFSVPFYSQIGMDNPDCVMQTIPA